MRADKTTASISLIFTVEKLDNIPFDFHSCVHCAADIVVAPVIMYRDWRGEFKTGWLVCDVVVSSFQSRTCERRCQFYLHQVNPWVVHFIPKLK